MELEGAVSVVTGAAAGIGRATAFALAERGSDVVVADIDGAGAHAAAEEVQRVGRRSQAVRVDVTRRDELEALTRQAIDWQGHCDVFVSNVGVGCHGAPHEFTVEQWTYLIDVNLWSCIWPLRSIVPHMIERGRGHLVFVSSGAGIEAQAERAPYNVAKFGIVGLAESVARYLKPTGVGVSLVVPGAVSTDSWKRYVPAGELDSATVDSLRAKHRDQSSTWPSPESMAAKIVDGILQDRYCIVQENPYQPNWFAEILEHKGRDPDGFVLGG